MTRQGVRWRRVWRRGRRGLQLLRTVGQGLLRRPADVGLVMEAMRLHHAVPVWMQRPLPLLMRQITPPEPAATRLSQVDIAHRTQLIDAVVHLDRTVPLGICLRRSLVRYVLLRRAGVPVTIIFGARPKMLAAGGLLGHAWIELDGQPWMEPPENVEGFAVMYRYPEAG